MMFTPPPYVPPEHRHKKYNEMPEPYKSEITAWIESNIRIYESWRIGLRNGIIFTIILIGFFAVAFFYIEQGVLVL